MNVGACHVSLRFLKFLEAEPVVAESTLQMNEVDRKNRKAART